MDAIIEASSEVTRALMDLSIRVGRFEGDYSVFRDRRGAGFDSGVRYLAERVTAGDELAIAAFEDSIRVERYRRLGVGEASADLGKAQERFGAVSRAQLRSFQERHYPWEATQGLHGETSPDFHASLDDCFAEGLRRAGALLGKRRHSKRGWRLELSCGGSPVAVEFTRGGMDVAMLGFLRLREWDVNLILSDPFFFSWVEFPCVHGARIGQQVESFSTDFEVVWPGIAKVIHDRAGAGLHCS